MAKIIHPNTSQLLSSEPDVPEYHVPTENEKELTDFVLDHTDRWRDYRDQNHLDEWEKYERIFRGQWKEEDKTRKSERSRVISPASQQAVETRHAEVMEALFGQGEFFDIQDDLADQNGKLDVGKLKAQLNEDFKRDKIRKAFDHIELMAEVYGTGIGEVVVGSEKFFYPTSVPIPDGSGQMAYGSMEKDRVFVRLNPVNPKNFLFDPNGTSIDDCMGVAVERNTSIHKIIAGINAGNYLDVDITSMYENDKLEPTQERSNFRDEKVKLLTYYGLVPREYLQPDEEIDELDDSEDETEDYDDMVEAIVVIANGSILLKAEENPYMMKDRPILCYQDDTVPNRLLGRGTIEKAINMQSAIDGSVRSHMDSLALTSAPMMGMDATRLPRGQKFEVKPGGNFMVNGNPAEILMPFKFGMTDGQSMETSKEFERMLLMATSTIDSNGQMTQVSREMDMATATMLKKYKRALVNRQEDFIIPFITKAAWRYMQFDPERYPSIDVKFLPTATLGIIAREYEQKQLAFLIQTLGKESPLTPVLMTGILENSSLTNREQMVEQLAKLSQPDPQQQQMQMQMAMKQMQLLDAQIATEMSKAAENQAKAQKAAVEAQLAPDETKAKILSAISRNLPNEDDQANAEFDRRVEISKLMLQERDIESNEKIAEMQTQAKNRNSEYLDKVQKMN